MSVMSVRLTTEDVKRLQAVAEQEHKERSAVVRELLREGLKYKMRARFGNWWGVIVSLLGFGLSGCATPHRAKGFQGDYSTVQFGDEVFKVALESREAFDRQMGEQLLLRRAANVTLQNGLTHFVVLSQDRATGLGFVARPGIIGPVRQTSQAITIRCYRGTPELAGAVDAQRWLRDHP